MSSPDPITCTATETKHSSRPPARDSTSPSPSNPRARRKRTPSVLKGDASDSDSSLRDSDHETPKKRKNKRGKRSKRPIKIVGNVSGAVVQIGDDSSLQISNNHGLSAPIDPSDFDDIISVAVSEVDDLTSNMPLMPDPPKFYTEAVKLFKNENGEIIEPTVLPSNKKARFYFDYISTALRHISYCERKLACLWWIPELKEGWYDSSLWCHIIDTLCAQSMYLTVLRKEIQIIPRGHLDRFDGVFRWMNGMNDRFDLGVIEVGPMPQLPNSDPKPAADRAKIIRGMSVLLSEARKRTEDAKLQIIGISCSGWSITILRMWHDGTNHVVCDQKFTIWTVAEQLSKNFEVFEALVQAVKIIKKSASLLSDSKKRSAAPKIA